MKPLLCLLAAALLAGGPGRAAAAPPQGYVLAPNDVVEIKVYQEDDLETRARIGKEGAISFPLIGTVVLGGKTVPEAAALIGAELRKNYLVNPQVTLIVAEYAKRRFTVLGQVQRPGSFEIPSEESMNLLQAIAVAGGYTRLADKGGVQVTRMNGGKPETLSFDLKHKADRPETMGFEVRPDDTITVPERMF